MKNKLKPCPFCGDKAKLFEDYSGLFTVQCEKCGISTLLKRNSEEVIADWNRRIG